MTQCKECEREFYHTCDDEDKPCVSLEYFNKGVTDFANWLVKYKVLGENQAEELIRDFNGERGN